eukprot:CAMPEP_0202697674 /NCGR_PEP_ID=MMETSP1385-20130828/10988_1 /ASSEMBLY_ACC=CAM_ASM_000861 /TAXON_ID=933848 /ORGANISM="Elphidium margaritaceum" /LENGTH=619 /DNA_ID=CAMNT_0049354189 /DNA_START=70 /DNA_END=1926 /DNA_ORIENTATION=+
MVTFPLLQLFAFIHFTAYVLVNSQQYSNSFVCNFTDIQNGDQTELTACGNQRMECTPGQDCALKCDDFNACKDATLVCPENYACAVTCGDSTTNTCSDLNISGFASSQVTVNGCDIAVCKQLHVYCPPNDAGTPRCALSGDGLRNTINYYAQYGWLDVDTSGFTGGTRFSSSQMNCAAGFSSSCEIAFDSFECNPYGDTSCNDGSTPNPTPAPTKMPTAPTASTSGPTPMPTENPTTKTPTIRPTAADPISSSTTTSTQSTSATATTSTEDNGQTPNDNNNADGDEEESTNFMGVLGEVAGVQVLYIIVGFLALCVCCLGVLIFYVLLRSSSDKKTPQKQLELSQQQQQQQPQPKQPQPQLQQQVQPYQDANGMMHPMQQQQQPPGAGYDGNPHFPHMQQQAQHPQQPPLPQQPVAQPWYNNPHFNLSDSSTNQMGAGDSDFAHAQQASNAHQQYQQHVPPQHYQQQYPQQYAQQFQQPHPHQMPPQPMPSDANFSNVTSQSRQSVSTSSELPIHDDDANMQPGGGEGVAAARVNQQQEETPPPPPPPPPQPHALQPQPQAQLPQQAHFDQQYSHAAYQPYAQNMYAQPNHQNMNANYNSYANAAAEHNPPPMDYINGG